MLKRLVIGPIIIACLVGLFVLDHHLERPYAFFALAVLASALCAGEVAKMFDARGFKADRAALMLTGAVLLLLVFLKGGGSSSPIFDAKEAAQTVLISIVFLMVILGVSNVWNRDVQAFMPCFAATLTVFLYVFVPTALLLWIRRIPEYGEWLIYTLIAVAKLCDSGAYFTGKAIGKHKLIPQVSPGKTVEGLIGGLVVGTAAGMGCWYWMSALQDLFNVWQMAGLSLALALIAAHGDLVASALKRGANVKDSGRVLPEFGGVLDVVDNFLIVGPALYLILVFVFDGTKDTVASLL